MEFRFGQDWRNRNRNQGFRQNIVPMFGLGSYSGYCTDVAPSFCQETKDLKEVFNKNMLNMGSFELSMQKNLGDSYKAQMDCKKSDLEVSGEHLSYITHCHQSQENLKDPDIEKKESRNSYTSFFGITNFITNIFNNLTAVITSQTKFYENTDSMSEPLKSVETWSEDSASKLQSDIEWITQHVESMKLSDSFDQKNMFTSASPESRVIYEGDFFDTNGEFTQEFDPGLFPEFCVNSYQELSELSQTFYDAEYGNDMIAESNSINRDLSGRANARESKNSSTDQLDLIAPQYTADSHAETLNAPTQISEGRQTETCEEMSKATTRIAIGKCENKVNILKSLLTKPSEIKPKTRLRRPRKVFIDPKFIKEEICSNEFNEERLELKSNVVHNEFVTPGQIINPKLDYVDHQANIRWLKAKLAVDNPRNELNTIKDHIPEAKNKNTDNVGTIGRGKSPEKQVNNNSTNNCSEQSKHLVNSGRQESHTIEEVSQRTLSTVPKIPNSLKTEPLKFQNSSIKEVKLIKSSENPKNEVLAKRNSADHYGLIVSEISSDGKNHINGTQCSYDNLNINEGTFIKEKINESFTNRDIAVVSTNVSTDSNSSETKGKVDAGNNIENFVSNSTDSYSCYSAKSNENKQFVTETISSCEDKVGRLKALLADRRKNNSSKNYRTEVPFNQQNSVTNVKINKESGTSIDSDGSLPHTCGDKHNVSNEHIRFHATDESRNSETEIPVRIPDNSEPNEAKRNSYPIETIKNNLNVLKKSQGLQIPKSRYPRRQNNPCKSDTINKKRNYIQNNIIEDMKFANEIDTDVFSCSLESPTIYLSQDRVDFSNNKLDMVANTSPHISENSSVDKLSGSTESSSPDDFDEIHGKFCGSAESNDSFQIVFTDSPQNKSPRNRRPSDCGSEDSFIVFQDDDCYTNNDVFGQLESCSESEYDSDCSDSGRGTNLISCSFGNFSRTISDLTDETLYEDNTATLKQNSDSEDETDCAFQNSDSSSQDECLTQVENESNKLNTGLLLTEAKKLARKDQPPKQVRFSERKPEVHVMRVWAYAARRARVGNWERYSLDRERFKRRIADVDMAISWVLKPQHRSRVKFQRFMPWWNQLRRKEIAEKKAKKEQELIEKEEREKLEREELARLEKEELDRAEVENKELLEDEHEEENIKETDRYRKCNGIDVVDNNMPMRIDKAKEAILSEGNCEICTESRINGNGLDIVDRSKLDGIKNSSPKKITASSNGIVTRKPVLNYESKHSDVANSNSDNMANEV